ncbi:hypothetical protein Pmani_019044 [Petrolisthes manimaculis]|uniref:Uncharacterized protein n=1 Tax=Petrolisthes manimaculis TaxID=1843537 RepID=A0AAE1U847_9EUCA|nr:hypothetical protein Pmani_019044 [Petrolisthes manimaculis]
MKTLVYTFLIVVAVVSPVWSAICKCDATVELEEGEIDVLILPVANLSDCSQNIACAGYCKETWTLATNGGDLTFVMQNGVTVGQQMCNELNDYGAPTIGPHTAYVYYNLCSGPWIYDGMSTMQDLCCQDAVNVAC